MFWAKIRKNFRVFYLKIFSFLEVKLSIHLNRSVFLMIPFQRIGLFESMSGPPKTLQGCPTREEMYFILNPHLSAFKASQWNNSEAFIYILNYEKIFVRRFERCFTHCRRQPWQLLLCPHAFVPGKTNFMNRCKFRTNKWRISYPWKTDCYNVTGWPGSLRYEDLFQTPCLMIPNRLRRVFSPS